MEFRSEKGARLGAQRPKVKEKAKEKERGFRTAPGNKRPVTGEYYQRLGVISALVSLASWARMTFAVVPQIGSGTHVI